MPVAAAAQPYRFTKSRPYRSMNSARTLDRGVVEEASCVAKRPRCTGKGNLGAVSRQSQPNTRLDGALRPPLMTSPLVAAMRDRVRNGSATPTDAAVAASLITTLPTEDVYDALYVIGEAGDARYEEVVSRYLYFRADPFVARLALQVICNEWDLGESHVDDLLAFVRGVSWDLETGGFAREVAISAAGELLRRHHHPVLLQALLDCYDDEAEVEAIRRQAYSAVLRALGTHWRDVPGTASDLWRLKPDTRALATARRRVMHDS